MKYRTFRRLIFTGGICIAAGLALLVVRGRAHTPGGAEDRSAAAAPATQPRSPGPAAADAGAPGGRGAEQATAALADGARAPAHAPASSPGALRPLDEEILAAVRAGISGDKVKDALPGRPEKVNLYRDAGQLGVNRLKIDLDRDGRWDEKWTLKGGQVKRLVAPDDDERYTLEYRLRGGRWVEKER